MMIINKFFYKLLLTSFSITTIIILYVLIIDKLYEHGYIELGNLFYTISGYLVVPGLLIQALFKWSFWKAMHFTSYYTLIITNVIFYLSLTLFIQLVVLKLKKLL